MGKGTVFVPATHGLRSELRFRPWRGRTVRPPPVCSSLASPSAYCLLLTAYCPVVEYGRPFPAN
jgi:hypothetical protein